MKTRLCLGLAVGGLVLLAACGKQESAREIDWAKAALARNPAFEIVATDDTAGVFTVRDTATGVIQTLRLQDLVAAPLPKPEAKPAVAAAAPAAVPVESPAIADDTANTLASSQTTDVVAGESPGTGNALAEGPGYRITRGQSAASHNAPATLEGPGYSIARDPSAPRTDAKPTDERTAERVTGNVERRSDPIICQGDRLMHIDGETIEFSGDAIIAEKGCDLYISNSRLSAAGVGIIARQARVHIVNSSIGGTRASYEASQGAEIYVARSTITGVGRRFDSATMNDLGENLYPAN
ncbi:MAG TPA: hypothetical protein VGO61_20320 [Steroidobacteraceae bacterium]|jgi:hypothetical protein|nr:hypothetical protein [Steroidobacteraceae bacterium]